MSFGSALSIFTRRGLPIITIAGVFLSLIQSLVITNRPWKHNAEPSSSISASISNGRNIIVDLLLGNWDPALCLLFPLLLLMALGMVVCEHMCLQGLVSGASLLYHTCMDKGPRWLRSTIKILEPRQTIRTSQHIASIMILLLVVLLFAPYQFACLLAFLVHFTLTMRALPTAKETFKTTPPTARRLWDQYHYFYAILFLMLSLLPINGAILVVWIRNLSAGWFAPFSSDHNILKVGGILLWLEYAHSGKRLERRIKRPYDVLVPTGLAVIGSSAFLFGIRHTYLLYSLGNLFFYVLSFVHHFE